MNEAFEKILEKLEILKFPFPDECPSYCGNTNTLLDMAKQIVNQVAEEYNNGWIPCSVRLPEKYGEYLCCDEYGEYIIGYPTERTIGNSFYVETDNEIMNECIAWQPLPELYKERE